MNSYSKKQSKELHIPFVELIKPDTFSMKFDKILVKDLLQQLWEHQNATAIELDDAIEGEISINFKNVTHKEALDAILSARDLTMSVHLGLFDIYPNSKQLHQTEWKSIQHIELIKPDTFSMKFENILVKDLLKELGKHKNITMAVSDNAQEKISINFKNVTFDVALNTILLVKGLNMRQNSDVIFIDKRTSH